MTNAMPTEQPTPLPFSYTLRAILLPSTGYTKRVMRSVGGQVVATERGGNYRSTQQLFEDARFHEDSMSRFYPKCKIVLIPNAALAAWEEEINESHF